MVEPKCTDVVKVLLINYRHDGLLEHSIHSGESYQRYTQRMSSLAAMASCLKGL